MRESSDYTVRMVYMFVLFLICLAIDILNSNVLHELIVYVFARVIGIVSLAIALVFGAISLVLKCSKN